MTKHRMSIKLTGEQRRQLRRLSKRYGVTMTDVLVKGLEFVVSADAVQSVPSGGDVPDTLFLKAIPLKGHDK